MTNFDQPFQDYEILDRVGGGAMGTVFKARHKRLNRIVALKILKPSLARDKRYVERLRREARIVASLSHPNIVTGHDLGEEGGYHFFVMEFVEGKSLRQLLTEWGMFAEEYVLRVARETAMALDHAFERQVIHRDIKPANILIDESGSVKLTDMGLAKGPADLTLTRDGATVGTPMYISPEQARNPQDVDVRSDLYSLGATLYHMATGVPPFSGDTMAELITNVLNENVVPPDEANSAVSSGVSLIIRKLLAKNLLVRYQTPRELLDDLDRIERSQAPAVDAGRLNAEANHSSSWSRVVVLAMAAILLAGSAWWVGRQMVESGPVAPDSEQYLRLLDQELGAMATPGARHLKLSTLGETPSGTVRPIEERRRQVATELESVVDQVVTQIEGPGWPEVLAWLRNPLIWPYLAQFEQRYLLPRIRKHAGVALDQMPSRVSTLRVAQLRQAVARTLTERDVELVARYEQFLASVLPGRVVERLRVGDFASADELWRDALPTFCNGVGQPSLERLHEAMRSRLSKMLALSHREASGALDAAEQAVVRALRGAVSTTVQGFRQRLEAGADPMVLAEALQRFRANLGQFWPDSQNFRIGRDPWPEVEQQLMGAEHAIELAMNEAQGRRFDARCDLAWRVYCHGDPVAALAVMAEMEPVTDQQKQELTGHRRCLEAAQRVEQALLESIARQPNPPVAFMLGAAVPFALRVQSQGESLRLEGVAIGQAALPLRLTELRIDDLLRKLGAAETGPLREMASLPRALGLTVLRLVADDADGIERHIHALVSADATFVFERVWPRIERVRGERGNQSIDLASLFASLATALQNLDQGGSVNAFESALLAVEHTPVGQCTPKQQRLLRLALARRGLVRREQDLLQDISSRAPRGADVEVRVQDQALVAAITLPAAVLQGDAGEGWQLRGNLLEFAGGGGAWRDQPNLALRGNPGFDARSTYTRLELELSFPSGKVGRRSYLIEFDGISLMLAIAANDSVQVALIQGPALDRERADRAFAEALSGAFAPPRALAIAGGLHRLTIDVATVAPTQANVVVTFEGRELLRQLQSFDSKLRPDFALHPLQEVAVRQATVHVFDW